MLNTFIKNNQLNSVFKRNAKGWYIPLAKRLVEKQSQINGTFFIGFNGCQGSGKSTLVDFLAEYIQANYSSSVAVLSLDDFYLDHAVRKQIASDIHPLFAVRGVPGSHDTRLIRKTFDSLANSQQQIALPRFNKISDNPIDKNDWPQIQTPVDIVLMEGWCWGVPAQRPKDLETAVNDLEEQQDPDSVWRNRVNKYIEQDYLPLYHQMNYWIMLKAPGFNNVLKWRFEQEQKQALKSRAASENIMSKSQICHFINHYQRLTEYALDVMPKKCSEIFYLDDERNVVDLQATRLGN